MGRFRVGEFIGGVLAKVCSQKTLCFWQLSKRVTTLLNALKFPIGPI
jgi:hypothetical protein